MSFKHFGLKCQNCGHIVNMLHGVEVKWKPRVSDADSENGYPEVIRNINICKRCMRKFGLMERDKRDE